MQACQAWRCCIEELILVTTGIILVLLLVLLRRQKRPDTSTAGTPEREHRTCPLCGEALGPDERVKSVLYPAVKGAPDRMMEIFGCPHCYPSGNPRRCPVCKKEMKTESVCIARCFQKPGTTHVHVLGCSECYRKK